MTHGPPAAAPPTWRRNDITGLRALAIVPVVAFHAGATFLPGGFVGVDVFYVISGFLITALLVREVDSTGRVALAEFWARRARRLVPALILVVAVTAPIVAWLTPVFSWWQLAKESVASLFFVSNILFWRDTADYFDDGSGQSPFLHTWSLGVEEQFYVFWPLLVLVAIVLARKFNLTLKTVLAATFGLTLIVSLGLSILASPAMPTASFYLLPTRAWEFAAAGLVALVPWERFVRPALGWVLVGTGLVGLLASVVLLDGRTVYPGHAALLPVGATLAVIVGGVTSAGHLLAWRPLRWIGDRSYSWYLWHWPAIVIFDHLSPESSWAKPAGGALSLVLAHLSYVYVENPVRFDRRLVDSRRRTLVAGLTAVAVTAGLAVGVGQLGRHVTSQSPYNEYYAAANQTPSESCDDPERIAGVDACWYGDESATTTVALVGDSHSGHWKHALDRAGELAGVKILVRWRSACPSVEVSVLDSHGGVNAKCDEFRDDTMLLLQEIRPDAVILSNAYGYENAIVADDGRALSRDAQVQAWQDEFLSTVAELDQFTTVSLIRDNPRFPFNPTACLGVVGNEPTDCGVPRSQGVADIEAIDDAVSSVLDPDVPTFSVTDDICDTFCVAVDGDGTPVFQDITHLSRAWTLERVPELREFLTETLAETP